MYHIFILFRTIFHKTDGLDIGCENVHIYDSYIKNGDDSFCMKSGATDVLIENCTGTQGFGFVCGTNAHPPIRNITYRNCTWYDAEWAIKVKGGHAQNGTMSDILFEDITVINVSIPIYLDQINSHQCGTSKNTSMSVDKAYGSGMDNMDIDILSDDGLGYLLFENITFRNIEGSYHNCAGTLVCTNYTACPNMVFENIDLYSTNKTHMDWYCGGYVYGNQYNVTPSINCTGIN